MKCHGVGDCWDIRVLDIVLAYVNDELHCSTVMKFWIFWSVFVILNVILLCIGNIALSLHVVRLCIMDVEVSIAWC